ncbi:MAG: aminotransferase class III-fold pyridoxal phosphate-dependent enzyme, partial [Gammaproteobacteria bacterium]|nr:aminotransferase class III-fold pyridoxal phosphate-dependent enzyme [Gammaproteobacteria bacterium]
GNPLACAAALATMETLQRDSLPARAEALGARFMSRFDASRLERVRAVRQMGLMIGIELREKARPYLEALMTRGVLALPAGPTVIRLLPPLVIDEAQIDSVATILQEELA